MHFVRDVIALFVVLDATCAVEDASDVAASDLAPGTAKRAKGADASKASTQSDTTVDAPTFACKGPDGCDRSPSGLWADVHSRFDTQREASRHTRRGRPAGWCQQTKRRTINTISQQSQAPADGSGTENRGAT